MPVTGALAYAPRHKEMTCCAATASVRVAGGIRSAKSRPARTYMLVIVRVLVPLARVFILAINPFVLS